MQGKHSEALLQELRQLWQARVGHIEARHRFDHEDFDVMALTTYEILRPAPDFDEVHHGLLYLMQDILRVDPALVRELSLAEFARQLKRWRATQSDLR
jgi:hypothetical protein